MIENGYEVHDSEASEVELGDFLYGLVRYAKPALVVETGCYLGHTTKRLGEAVRDNGSGQVWSCDINQDHVIVTRARCGWSLPVIVSTQESLHFPELPKADLVFSDSASQAMRMEEFERCKAGCIFVVHDTWGHGAEHNKTLADWVRSKGGMVFPFGRGFGVIIK